MPKTAERLLGFDFGKKRIGVAVGQMITRTASPECLLPAEQGIPDPDALEALFATWQPDACVVGLPLPLDGEPGHIAHAAKKFANRMRERFQVPVYLVDEYLTTQIAKRLSSDHPVDAVSAALILETWLQNQP